MTYIYIRVYLFICVKNNTKKKSSIEKTVIICQIVPVVIFCLVQMEMK